jgi:glycosyltransferase involved in cell wall biosynthesis
MEKQEARQILGWSPSSKVVLFVTVGGHPRKRLDLAQKAVEKINGRMGDVTLRVTQGVPHDRVPIWMNAADVLILTSVHEGSVNAVKEAMACNLPIVSVDVGDVRERLAGVRMCSIAEANPVALANALADLLYLGQRSDGRDHLGNLTTVAIATRLKQFYREALGRACDPSHVRH